MAAMVASTVTVSCRCDLASRQRRRSCWTKVVSAAKAEGIEDLGLHLGADVVDGVDTEVGGTDAIAELALARGSFDDVENGVGDFLGIGHGGSENCVHLIWKLRGGAVGVGAGMVGGGDHVAEDGSLVGAGFDDGGFNSLPGEFVVVGLSERFHGEFAGAVESRTREARRVRHRC